MCFKNYVGRSLVFSPCKELNGAGIPPGNHLIIGMVVNREQRERERERAILSVGLLADHLPF